MDAPLISNTIEAALYYLSRGWYVTPIPQRRKGPIGDEWPAYRFTPEDVPQRFSARSNIGIILGEPSGWLVDVDLDCEEARALAPEYLPATDVKTGRPSAIDSHWWYISKGAHTAQYNDPVNKTRIVELRSTGGQTVVGPSIHPSREQYSILSGTPPEADAADLSRRVEALAHAVATMRHGEPEPSPMILPMRKERSAPVESAEDRAIAYLDTIESAVSGQNGHSKTFWAAQVLVNGFRLGASEALSILSTHYNPRCVPPWSEKELQHKVESAIKHPPTEKAVGWLLEETYTATAADDPGVDIGGILGTARPTVDPFPEHLLNVPGMIGEVVAYNLATAHRPQPILALAGAIALQAVLAGRKVRDARGNRTNVYLIGLAVSGGGKEHARKVNRSILALAGVEKAIGPEDLASDAGLITAVTNQKTVLFQIDEFGRFLKTLNDERASHLYAITSVFLKLYSSADSMFVGKAYANSEKNITINQPCAVLYATTVPESFWGSLTAESLSNGFLARLLVFESTELPAEQDAIEQAPPTELLEAARWWFTYTPGGNLAGENPEPLVVDSTPEAKSIIAAFGIMADSMRDNPLNARFHAILARAKENAYKLALIYACSESRTAPVIDEAAMRWACELTNYLIRRVIASALDNISESAFDAIQNRILKHLRAAPGAELTRKQLVRAMRGVGRRLMQDAIDTLSEAGYVRVTTTKTNGRPRSVIQAI